jgi:hypothetical protein
MRVTEQQNSSLKYGSTKYPIKDFTEAKFTISIVNNYDR